MTKSNRTFNWKNLRNEEIGTHDDDDELEQGNSSNSQNNWKNDHIDGEEPQNGSTESRAGRGRIEQLQLNNVHRRDYGHEIANNRMLANDELHIAATEHPGMVLTTDLFDGNNFYSWCRAVKRGLFAKNKLGLIDGTLTEPRPESVDYRQWIKVDYLVFNWLSNSIIKEIARGFQSLENSKQLWDELHVRFGKRNGPRLYKLRREIATYSQKTQSVMQYFNNLNRLWDDLDLLKNSRSCTCEAAHDAKADLEEEHMMGFLMGLNEIYEGIRKQILIQDPLPNVSQAYGMVLEVEEQINISNHFSENIEQSALYNSQRGGNRNELYKKRLTKEEKQKLKCEHCGGIGHLKPDCFGITGVPEWYKKYKIDRNKGRVNFVGEEQGSWMQEGQGQQNGQEKKPAGMDT